MSCGVEAEGGGTLNLLEELQNAQQETEVQITLQRKEEPLEWLLEPDEDAEKHVQSVQRHLGATLRKNMYKAASIISGHDDGISHSAGSSSHAGHTTDKHDIR